MLSCGVGSVFVGLDFSGCEDEDDAEAEAPELKHGPLSRDNNETTIMGR